MKLGSLETQKQVSAFLLQSDTRAAMSDRQVRGLQLDRIRLEQGIWRLRYRTPVRKRRGCITIGSAQFISLAQARTTAKNYLYQISQGRDPKAEQAELASVPTFGEFIEKQYLPYVDGYKKTAWSDRSYLRIQILPVLGHKYLDQIRKIDIINLHHGLLKKGYAKGTCNRSLVLVRYVFNLAIKWGVPGIKENPGKDVPLFEDHPMRERFIDQHEHHRLIESVQDSVNPMLPYIISMLILTGARKREVLDARWDDFNVQTRQWRIPVTKAGKPRYVPLSDGVLKLLTIIPRWPNCPYMFPNPKTLLPYRSVFKSWHTARKRVGLADVRMHDLRHSFASFLVNAGRSLYEVQKILGHSQISTTQRYAHLSQDTLIDAANAVFIATRQSLPEPKTAIEVIRREPRSRLVPHTTL